MGQENHIVHAPDLETAEPILALQNGSWSFNGIALQELQLNSNRLQSSGGEISVAIKDIVGVHREGHTLRFIAYEVKRSFSSKKLVRREFVIKASGKISEEERNAMVSQWHNRVQELMEVDEEVMKKPLLVLINPCSGRGVALKLWKSVGEKVIAHDAGHKVEVLVTQKQNHAREYLQETPDITSKFKGILVVSGDGLFFEALQGIMERADWSDCVRSLTFGILPGGSGNGLARSISADANLPPGMLASSVIVARGKRRGLDIASVDIYDGDKVKRVYSFLSMSWALLSDVDIGSEYLRWMGEPRFTVEALKRILFLRKYRGRLSFKPAEGAQNGLPRTSKGLDGSKNFWEEDTTERRGRQPVANLLPPPGQPVDDNWVVVDDTFYAMWNCNTKWMTTSTLASPHSDLGDGFIQLQYVRKHGSHRVSRWKLLKYLLGLDGGTHLNMPFVEMTPTEAYRLEPLPDRKGKLRGIIAIDGEQIDYSSIQVQNYRQLLEVYA